jgi:hypothetical protein
MYIKKILFIKVVKLHLNCYNNINKNSIYYEKQYKNNTSSFDHRLVHQL